MSFFCPWQGEDFTEEVPETQNVDYEGKNLSWEVTFHCSTEFKGLWSASRIFHSIKIALFLSFAL